MPRVTSAAIVERMSGGLRVQASLSIIAEPPRLW
jgi:hypothetical protein